MNEKQTHTKVLQVLLEEERSKSWLARKVGITNTIMNINKARTAWLREGLCGGDFDDWKPNGKVAPDDVLKQLTNEEQLDLYKIIQISQSVNPKKPSSSA